MNDLVTLRYFYNLGIDFFRQNQFRMLPPPVPLGLETGNAIGSMECSINEAINVRDLINDLEDKVNISSSSSTNNDPNSNNSRQRCTANKNENYNSKQNTPCTTKQSKRILEHKNLRSRATQACHSSVPPKDYKRTTLNNDKSLDSMKVFIFLHCMTDITLKILYKM